VSTRLGAARSTGGRAPSSAGRARQRGPRPPSPPAPIDLPSIIVDVRPNIEDRAALDRTGRRLCAVGAAALVGEHVDDPEPSNLAVDAELVNEHDLAVIATLTRGTARSSRCRSWHRCPSSPTPDRPGL
jgi:hypothetical protein